MSAALSATVDHDRSTCTHVFRDACPKCKQPTTPWWRWLASHGVWPCLRCRASSPAKLTPAAFVALARGSAEELSESAERAAAAVRQLLAGVDGGAR